MKNVQISIDEETLQHVDRAAAPLGVSRSGRRPALVLTRQGVIAHVNKVTVAEITSRGKGYPTAQERGQRALR